MVSVGSLALAITTITATSTASAVNRRQIETSTCVAACSDAFAASKVPDACASDVFLVKYATCLLCSGIFGIWDEFSADLTPVATACGLSAETVGGFPNPVHSVPTTSTSSIVETTVTVSGTTTTSTQNSVTSSTTSTTPDASVSSGSGQAYVSSSYTASSLFDPIITTTSTVIISGTAAYTSVGTATQVPTTTTITTALTNGTSTYTTVITTTWCPPVDTFMPSISASGVSIGTGGFAIQTKPAEFIGVASRQESYVMLALGAVMLVLVV